jgi:hypothetical protein
MVKSEVMAMVKETVIAMKIAVPETVKVMMPKSEVMTMVKTSKLMTKSAAARNMRCHASVSLQNLKSAWSASRS